MNSCIKRRPFQLDNVYGNLNPEIQDEVLSDEYVELMFGTSDASQIDPDLLSLAYYYIHDNIVEADKDVLNKLYKGFIDFPAIKEAIIKTHISGYKTLYDIQKANISLRKINIPIKNFEFSGTTKKNDTNKVLVRNYVCHTDINLIKSDKEYTLYSQKYQNGLSLMEISEDTSVFRFNILPMIDGKLLWNVRVIPKTDGTDIMFSVDTRKNITGSYYEGIYAEDYQAMCDSNKEMSIIVVPNYYMEVIKAPVKFLNPRPSDRPLNVPYHHFKSFNKFEPGSSLFFVNTTTNSYMTSMLQYEMDERYVTFDNFFKYGIDTFGTMVIVGIKLNCLDDIRVINLNDTTDGWFILHNYELPLPKENIIALKLIDDKEGRKCFSIDDTVDVDIYYPNIYKANNIKDKDIRLLMFYADKRYDTSYDNYIKTFYTHYNQLLEIYRTKPLPEIVKTYEPVNIPLITNTVYDELSVYFPFRKNQFITKFFESYINKNPRLFLNYLCLKLRSSNKYTIRASSINLPSRIRRNTYTEINDIGIPMKFDKPRYVINLRRNFVGIGSADFKVFVDGVALSSDTLFITNSKDHFLFYIDADIVKDSSIIEIEKYNRCFKRFNNYDDIISTEGVVIDIYGQDCQEIQTLFPDIKTVPVKLNLCTDGIDRIDVYNLTLLSKGHIINNSKIRAFVYDSIVEQFIEIDLNGHYIVSGNIYFCFSEEYIGNKVGVIYDTSVVTHTVNITDSRLIDTTLTTIRNTRPNDIRIFNNGLLMLGNKFITDIYTDSNTNINIYTEFEEEYPGLYSFEAYPIEFKVEYSLDNLEYENGYVDTGDSLSYPLDLRWYDIFLNGKKLHKDNIEIISSNKFFIKNVDSRKNLFVIKREGINDPFSANHDEDSMNIYLNNSDDLLDMLLQDKEVIHDTSEDIIKETIEDLTHLEFVKTYLEFTHINPNERQLTPEIVSKFSDMVDEYGILKLKTSDNAGARYVTQINSNIRRDYMKQNQYRYSFTPLYVGNHEDALNGEYLCDPITGLPAMKTNDGDILTSGLLTRLSMHKDRLNTKLINNGLTDVSIYQLDTNKNTMAINANTEVNILDDTLDVNLPCSKFMFSMDLDVLEKDSSGVLYPSDYDPTISLTYTRNDNEGLQTRTISRKLSDWNESPVTIDATDLNITDIRIESDPEQPKYVKFIIYSMLLAL